MFEKERFRFRRILTFIALTTMVIASPASSQQSPPTSEHAKQVEAMVNKAAALIESEGKEAAFAQFRKRDSEWWFDNTYIFAYDHLAA